jgi:1-acyl-sn-glycerol-3-phosphate acyltransferase
MSVFRIKAENYEEVYDHFRDVKLNKMILVWWCASMNAIFKPRVNYAEGAREDLDLIKEKDYHHIYAFNHRRNSDGYIVVSICHQIAPQDIGNTRTLATSRIFEEKQYIPIMNIIIGSGCIPVFLKPYYKGSWRHRRHPERLGVLPHATEGLFDFLTHIQTKHRQKIIIFPEGKYNKGSAPDTLLTVRRGVGEIAHRVAQIDGPVAVTTIGITYEGKKNRMIKNPRNTSVYIERSIFVEPEMAPDQITELVRSSLLSSVQNAVALY